MGVRIVRLERLEQLETVAEGVFDGPVRAEFASAFIDCPRHVMFLAVAEDVVAGMISGVEYFHPDKPAQMWINELGVGDAYRRRGIGRALLTTLLDHARQTGCRSAFVVTEGDNGPARNLYATLEPQGTEAEAVFFEWTLAASGQQG